MAELGAGGGGIAEGFSGGGLASFDLQQNVAIPIASTLSALTDGVDESLESATGQLGISTNFTLLLWFRTDFAAWNAANGGMFSKGDTAAGNLAMRLYVAGTAQLRLGISTDGSTFATFPRIATALLNTQEWVQLVITGDAGAADPFDRIRWWYANAAGTALTEATVTESNIFTSTNDVAGANTRIGRFFTNQYGRFYFLDCAMFTTTLTPAEVQLTRAGTLPANLSFHPRFGDLAFWVRCGSGTGDTFPTILDQSGNAFDFTMTNMEPGDLVPNVPV